MSRRGNVNEAKKEEWLLIECKNVSVLIKGISAKKLGQIEGNAIAYGDVPFNITDIKSIKRVALDSSDIKPIKDSQEKPKA